MVLLKHLPLLQGVTNQSIFIVGATAKSRKNISIQYDNTYTHDHFSFSLKCTDKINSGYLFRDLKFPNESSSIYAHYLSPLKMKETI